jgi:catechol 2,3-dioxygenase-like lactoylglutathione lyase family enzyme
MTASSVKEVIVYDHIGLKVRDIDASVRFYGAVSEALGLEKDSSGTGFGPKGEPALWLYEGGRSGGSGTHVAFRAKSHAAVDKFHAAGLKAGGKDHGKPGVRKDYSPKYYAAFLLDPDGNNVEAVCME